MSRWFRFYDDAINDPKVLKLPEAMRWYWAAMLCVASKNEGSLPALDDIAIQLRVTAAKATEIIACLVKATLLDKTEAGFEPHNWNGRQYKTDTVDPTAASRSKRYRDKKRDERDATVTHERPETETETETDSSLRSEGARKRGARLHEDWCANAVDWQAALDRLGIAGATVEVDKFRDYWKAQPGQRGVKLDWDATWRNWIRNAKGLQNNGKRTIHDAAKDLTGYLRSLDEPAPSLREREGSGSLWLLPPGGRE